MWGRAARTVRAVLCLVHVLHPCIGLTENIDASGVGMAFPVDIVIDSPEGEHVSIACEDEAAVFLRFRLFLPAGQFKMVDNWMLMIGTAQLGAAPEHGVSAGGKGALWRSAKQLRVDSTSTRPKQMMQYLPVRLGICDLVGPGTEGNDAEEEVRCMYASRLAGHPCAWKRPQAMFYEVLLIKRASAASTEERRQPSTGTFLGIACGFSSDGSVCEEGFLLGVSRVNLTIAGVGREDSDGLPRDGRVAGHNVAGPARRSYGTATAEQAPHGDGGLRGWTWVEEIRMWLPACWNTTAPLAQQTEVCLWAWNLVKRGRQLYYDRQEFLNALSTFPLDRDPKIEEILEKLPESDPPSTATIDSCAVVGNSWILANSSMGQLIDNHSAVIRLNDAPVVGFESDVGTRCTHRLIEMAALWNRESLKNDFPGQVQILRLSPVTPNTVGWVLEQYVRRRVMYASHSRIKLLSRAFVDDLYINLMGDYRRQGLITTGMLAILWALHSCDRVSTFGFGGGIDVRKKTSADGLSATGAAGVHGSNRAATAQSLYAARYNYYSVHTDTNEHILWPWHDWEKENSLHNRLERARVLKRYFPGDSSEQHKLRHFSLPSWCAGQAIQNRSCRLPVGLAD